MNKIGNLIMPGHVINKRGNVTEWFIRKDGELVLDPQLKMMFQGMVMPVLRQLPSDGLRDIREYLNQQIDEELQKREQAHQGEQP